MDVMAHAPLIRNNTTPIFKRDRDKEGIPAGTMSSAPRTSQLSGSTAFNSSTQSLNSLSSAQTVVTPMNGAGGPVIATANIINQKADASRSLYQICISLRQRLNQVPGLEPYLEELDPNDPVDSLWNFFRMGMPFLTIFNALQPAEPIGIDEANANAPEAKKSKIAVFKFVQACLKDLNIPSADCFVISDVLGTDTSGFVKVTQVVNYVLDVAEQRGLLLQAQPYPDENTMDQAATSQMSYRDHILKELVDTERKYVQDLENLHDLKKTLEQKGIVPGDVVHQIFLNINAILDFQRRFLIRVETTNSMPANNQRWGSPFVTFEESFDIYTPFIANQRKAAQTANLAFDKIQAADHPVAVDFNTLDGFLLKPMQRLVKYPLLLKDLCKKSEDEIVKQDLTLGIEAAERVLTKANEAVNRDLLDEAMEDLKVRVDDWRSHRIEQFGNLLLHGVYTVVTGRTDQEKDYEIYLFQYILLCCKEASASKSKDKKDKTRSTGPKIRNRNAKLQLKGRIFMTNVTEVVTLAKQGSYSIQIWWKGDPGVENFTIKFSNEETMKKWASGLEAQRKANTLPKSTSSPDLAPPEFPWLRAQANSISAMENPYKEQDMDEEEDYGAPGSVPFGVTQSTGGTMLPRNASNTSLRQRSATGDSSQSLAGIARAPPPRYPLPTPPAPLSLQTQLAGRGAPSPGERLGESYFSPIADSPVSSRTSTTSGMMATPGYPFPKTTTPQPPWEDTTNRYTAPAMPRAPSRDGTSPNAYGRGARGPSLPGMPPSAAQQQRSRSYSTPDINGQPNMRRNTAGPGPSGVPAVPGIPAHLHHDTTIPRSQSGSPRMDMPIRSNTQSPGVQRERIHQSSGSIGGTMSQFPAQPIYPRQTTPGPAPGQAPMSMDSQTVSPPPNMANNAFNDELALPTQLKVKVNCEGGTYFTLVVAFNITYQTLIDRIDAKLARFTSSSIGRGLLKLRYRDEDGDYVSIESDDDIQIAFLEWRDGMRNMYPGGVGEIELFCVGDTPA